MNENRQRELEGILSALKKSGERPRVLLHACCAPCSSYVAEYLKEYFDLTVFFFNPNIQPEKEYLFRLEEEKRLMGAWGIPVTDEPYDAAAFFAAEAVAQLLVRQHVERGRLFAVKGAAAPQAPAARLERDIIADNVDNVVAGDELVQKLTVKGHGVLLSHFCARNFLLSMDIYAENGYFPLF